MRRRETIVFVLILMISVYVSQYMAAHPEPKTTTDDRARLLALVGNIQNTQLQLDTAQKNSSCAIQGSLPDHSCTPGAVFPGASTSTICVAGYTQTVRNVPVRVKKQVYANY